MASIPARLKRVLVVDDEENIRHLLLVVLKKAGYEPTAVAGGAEALAMLAEDDFGVVISDIRMPGMSGPLLPHRWHSVHSGLYSRNCCCGWPPCR